MKFCIRSTVTLTTLVLLVVGLVGVAHADCKDGYYEDLKDCEKEYYDAIKACPKPQLHGSQPGSQPNRSGFQSEPECPDDEWMLCITKAKAEREVCEVAAEEKYVGCKKAVFTS